MWIIILSGCISITLVMSLVFCLCWRKKSPTDDWQGLDGMVIQKNPDENVNHLPSAAVCEVDGLSNVNDQSSVNKRNVVTTTTKRSLPDIPAEQLPVVNWEPTGDNSSEHYATVGQYPNANKRNNATETASNLPQYNSISRIEEKPYERVRYDKIQSSEEHPYAQLQPSTSRSAVHEESQGSTEERTTLLRSDGIVNAETSHPPSRSRRSSVHSNGGLDIPAASAVAGVLAASPELPYMTPPVTQANFSGDSQDSSKGYTSISVREPLAEIIAQTKEMNKKKRELDPHYSTVSDDSDDVYTTIADPNNPIYTSESETYAQIPSLPITVEVEVNQPQSAQQEVETTDELYEPAPQPLPPSVDSLKHVTSHNGPTYSHSRQASSSSSIANLGSPKPEKRQANSPLPPPPVPGNFDFHPDQIQAVKNLDDLYAKVHKNKKSDTSPEAPSESLSRSSDRRSLSGISITSNKSSHSKQTEEHNYETLKKTPTRRTSDPGYEKIKNNYEPGYASINGPESIPSSDPGYEVLKNRTVSEVGDPNYEELRHRVSNASDCSEYTRIKDLNDGYSVVNKLRKKQSNLSTFIDTIDEPNYESMRSENSDMTAKESNSSESDPNYESVSQNDDPNYESVKGMDDPPYERLDEDSSRTTSELSKSQRKGTPDSSVSQSDKTEPPYEQLQNDTDSEVPGYEKIKLKSPNKNNSNNSGSSENSVPNIDILDDDGIVQV